MTKPNKKFIVKIIVPILAVISSIIFIPWTMARAWLSPLPATIQEQVNDAIDYDLDGIIVYVEQHNKQPSFYTAGFNNKKKRFQ